MSWTNYHGHSDYCDGHKKIEDYIKVAIERKMPIIGISSHAPVPFDCFWTMKEAVLQSYLSEIECLQRKYQSEIVILSSLEIDYVPNVVGPSFSFFDDLKLDYKIGSVHFVDQFKDGEHWGIDGSLQEFEKGVENIFNGDVKLAVQRFYQLTREMVSTQKFEIIGHFDKIKMHNASKLLFDETSVWYQSELNETLDCIAENGVIVEVNTKSFERNGLLFPGIDLFKLMLGKKIPVTINSDAHYPEKIEAGFQYVAEKLYAAGYRFLKEYVNGEWVDVAFTKEGILW